jgi:hypothetical protein
MRLCVSCEKWDMNMRMPRKFTHSLHRTGMISGFTMLVFLLAASAQSFAQYALTCSSEDGRKHYCSADTRGGVTMERQRSHAVCTQGSTWGFDTNGVWVDKGCRADFLVTPAPSEHDANRDRDHDRGPNHDGDHDRDIADRDHDRDRHDYAREETMQLTCSSQDGGRHYCESDIQGKATMLRQRSGSPCREGYSWGNDRRGIWVDHGCRADFSLSGKRTASFGMGNGQPLMSTVTCSSNAGVRQLCDVDASGGVKLTRQISESACRMGYSWGYDRSGIWVDHGCRAEFEVRNRR